MKFNNIRLFVNDLGKYFRFYTRQLGLEPTWGMRVAYRRDQEDNLIEISTNLSADKCSEELIENNKKSE